MLIQSCCTVLQSEIIKTGQRQSCCMHVWKNKLCKSSTISLQRTIIIQRHHTFRPKSSNDITNQTLQRQWKVLLPSIDGMTQALNYLIKTDITNCKLNFANINIKSNNLCTSQDQFPTYLQKPGAIDTQPRHAVIPSRKQSHFKSSKTLPDLCSNLSKFTQIEIKSHPLAKLNSNSAHQNIRRTAEITMREAANQ